MNKIMKWISVKDRLPELATKDNWDYKNGFSDKVIVLVQGESYFAKYRQDISRWIVFGRIGNIQVTHWLPLPETLKTEEK